MILLAGEWVGAWLGMSITFLVASLGVVGLGWWVLRKDAINRAGEDTAETGANEAATQEGHH